MKKLISQYYIYGVITLWAIVCFLFYQQYYSYHFFYKEQNQIFLLSCGYIATYFSKPGWAACMAGDFLTQFYYYLYAGAVILTTSLLLMGDLLRRAFQRAGFGMSAFWIAIIAMTLEAVCHLKADFGLSSTFAIIGGTTVYLLSSFIFDRKVWIKIPVMIVATFVSYWMFGYGLWVFQILISVHLLRKCRKHPYHWGTMVYLIPLYSFFLIITVGRSYYLLSTDDAITYPGIGKLSMPNFELEDYLSVDNEYYFGHYRRVMMLTEKIKERTPEICFYYNLSLAQQDLLADKLLSIQPTDLGTFYRINVNTPITVIKMMNELYDALGDMTFTERAAMMANVFSPNNRNVRMLKRLAEANLVTNDTAAAMKYLRILDKTIVYRRWAEEHIPATQSSTVKKEIANKRQYLNKTDTIRITDDCRSIMLGLLQSNPNNKIALNYLLCSDLLLKDIAHFKSDYDRFCISTKRPLANSIYQQALMIYLAGTKSGKEEWNRYIISPSLMKDFSDYNQHRGDTTALSLFKDTYWYYFDYFKIRRQ